MAKEKKVMEEKTVTENSKKLKEIEVKKTDLTTDAYALSIDSAVACDQANEYIKACIALEKVVVDYFAEPKSSASKLHKKLVAMEKEQLEPLGKLKVHLKKGMTDFIAKEEAYNDGINALNQAKAVGEVVSETFPDSLTGTFLQTVKTINEKLNEGRAEVDPYEFKDEAQRLLKNVNNFKMQLEFVEDVIVEAPVVKASGTSLRKLSLSHEVSIASMQELVEAVYEKRVPIEWLTADLSAIKSSARHYESVDRFYEKYPNSGVMLKIERGVR